ncbi:MAG: isochorismate synthase [Jiangellales bacterium]
MSVSVEAVGAHLVVRSRRVDDPGALLDLLPRDGLAWVRRGDGMVAWGEVARWQLSGADRFAEAARTWRDAVRGAVVRDDVQVPGSGPVAFGSFTFADAGTSVLVVPEVVVGRRDGVSWVTTISAGDRVPPMSAPEPRDPPVCAGAVTFDDGSLTASEWLSAVTTAVGRITAGELDKVVLARDVVATTERPLDPRWPLERLAEQYPGCWTFQVDGLLGATPEMLIRLENGLATSRVLAGTIRRTGDDAHDLALAASLARSSKDHQEHEFAVRSVADALARHGTLNVPETPFVLHLPNVMHLATDVTGVVHDGRTALELVADLHPSAAVCGTPTGTARDVIAELEQLDRGRYAGPVGWMDARGDGEWAIALRCAHLEGPSRLRLYAGCGIVAGSSPQDELAEAEAKLTPMREALQSARPSA